MNRLPPLDTRSPASLLLHAEHATATGQLRMAMLYMRRAEQLLTEAQDRRRIQKLTALYGHAGAAFILAFRSVTEVLSPVFEQIAARATEVGQIVTQALPDAPPDAYTRAS